MKYMNISPRLTKPNLSQYRELLELEAFEYKLKNKLNQLGFEQAVLIILDPLQNYIYEYTIEFTEQQMHTYSSHQKHDPYITKYLCDNAFGQFIYLQDIISAKHIHDEVFWDILLPTMKIRHGMSGLSPLLNHYVLVFSCYCFLKPSPKQQLAATQLWHYLSFWGNNIVSKLNMSQQEPLLFHHQLSTTPEVRLTPAEWQVFNCLIQGMDGSEIARRRHVSKETIKSQIKQILHKTNSHHQNHLLAQYYNHKLIIKH